MNRKASFQLIQITDPHLHAHEEGTLLGMTTQESLDLVLDRIRTDHPRFDGVIATGDIAQDASMEAYTRFRSILSGFGVPARWCPGNHDDRDTMLAAAAGSELSDPVLMAGEHWAILLLNSAVPRKVYGNFLQDQLDLLRSVAGMLADRHLLIAFHHHPIAMGSRWIDQQKIRNGSDFMRIVRQFSNIRALLWGHVHQARNELLSEGRLRVMSSPSTCIQFEPMSADFSIDSIAPGYRTISLNPDGTVDSEVHRVKNARLTIDYNLKGY